jgi:Restriction endonuclease
MPSHKVLVLTREEEKSFGERWAEALNLTYGCDCALMVVNEEFTSGAFLERLAKEGREVVLCEFQMASHTAVSLQRTLNGANMSSRVQIATLSAKRSDPGEFYWLGGAAYEELGEREPAEVLAEVWQKLQVHRHRMGEGRSEVIALLKSFIDERDFREFAVQLFQHLQYEWVHKTHGPMEAGKDLVFYEQNRMGEVEYVGVQAKIGDVSASVAQPWSANILLLQTVAALNNRIDHLGRSHYLDKYVILASGTITEPARKQIGEFLRSNKYDKRVYFWGQEEIADVKVKYARAFSYLPR